MSQSTIGMPAVNRDLVLRLKRKVKDAVTEPDEAILIDLAKQEEDEEEERNVRLAFFRKKLRRRENENADRLHKKLLNAHTVVSWRNRIGKHHTVHAMDTAGRHESQDVHDQLLVVTMVTEIELMKQRFQQTISRHQEMLKATAGRRCLLRQAQMAQIEDWFAALPSVMQGLKEQCRTLPKKENQRPVTSEPEAESSRKIIRLKTEMIQVQRLRKME